MLVVPAISVCVFTSSVGPASNTVGTRETGDCSRGEKQEMVYKVEHYGTRQDFPSLAIPTGDSIRMSS